MDDTVDIYFIFTEESDEASSSHEGCFLLGNLDTLVKVLVVWSVWHPSFLELYTCGTRKQVSGFFLLLVFLQLSQVNSVIYLLELATVIGFTLKSDSICG